MEPFLTSSVPGYNCKTLYVFQIIYVKINRLKSHHICSLIFLPCSSIVLILKSIPVQRMENSNLRKFNRDEMDGCGWQFHSAFEEQKTGETRELMSWWLTHKSKTINSREPIVDMNVVLKASSENRNRMHVFPTPESPINKSLKRRS